MERHIIVRRAGEERERRAIDRPLHMRGQFVADGERGEVGLVGHRVHSSHPFRTEVTTRMSTQSSPAALMAFVSRSEEHTSELSSLMRMSYAAFCLKKKEYSAKRA